MAFSIARLTVIALLGALLPAGRCGPRVLAQDARDPATLLQPDALAYVEVKDLHRLSARLAAIPTWANKALAQALADDSVRFGMAQRAFGRLSFGLRELFGPRSEARRLTFVLLGERDSETGLQHFLVIVDYTDTASVRAELAGDSDRPPGWWHGWKAVEGKTVYASQGPAPEYFAVNDSRTIYSTSRDAVTTLLGDAPLGDNLASHSGFQKVRKRYGKMPLWAYCNLLLLLRAPGDGASRPGQANPVLELIDRLVDATSLLDVQLGVASVFEKSTNGAVSEIALIASAPVPLTKSLPTSGKFDPGVLRYVPWTPGYEVRGGTLPTLVARNDALTKVAKKLEGHPAQKALTDTLGRHDLLTERLDAVKVVDRLAPSYAIFHVPLLNDQNRFLRRFLGVVLQARERTALVHLTRTVEAKMKQPRDVVYRGVTLKRETAPFGSGFVILGDTFVYSSAHPVLEFVVDVSLDGGSLHDKLKLEGAFTTYDDFLLSDPRIECRTLFHQLLGDLVVHPSSPQVPGFPEFNPTVPLPPQPAFGGWDFKFLETMLPEEVPWMIGSYSKRDEIRFRSNLSVFWLLGGLHLTLYMDRVSSRCYANMKVIADAIRAHYAKTQTYPDRLADLGVDAARLVCPLDGGSDVTLSYEYRRIVEAKPREEGSSGPLIGWCRHAEHGRVCMEAPGEAYMTSESGFRSGLQMLERWWGASIDRTTEEDSEELDDSLLPRKGNSLRSSAGAGGEK